MRSGVTTCGPEASVSMFFGNGIPSNFTLRGQTRRPTLSGSLDIVAHELTHGVTSSIVQSDLHGRVRGAQRSVLRHHGHLASSSSFSRAGPGLGQADYLIGEDTFRSPGGGLNGIRSAGQSDRYSDDPDHYSLRFTGPEDNGGVHINSTIAISRVLSLPSREARNRVSRFTVQGVGAANREQIEKSFYRAFTFLLPASANFSTARAATIQAARDLYGANSAAATAITQAWTAVGVN